MPGDVRFYFYKGINHRIWRVPLTDVRGVSAVAWNQFVWSVGWEAGLMSLGWLAIWWSGWLSELANRLVCLVHELSWKSSCFWSLRNPTVYLQQIQCPTGRRWLLSGPSRALNVAHVGREARDQVRTERKGVGTRWTRCILQKYSNMSKIRNLIAWISFRKMCWCKIQKNIEK